MGRRGPCSRFGLCPEDWTVGRAAGIGASPDGSFWGSHSYPHVVDDPVHMSLTTQCKDSSLRDLFRTAAASQCRSWNAIQL